MFCPRCSSEYRPGFVECANCEVALVESLEVETLAPDRLEDTSPVGLIGADEEGQPVEVEGVKYDLLRVFPLEVASSLRTLLHEERVPVLLAPVDAEFPDQRPHFEVRVLHSHAEGAEQRLRAWWREQVRTQESAAQGKAESVEQCPACGADVPLDVAECPDCGLFIGLAEEAKAEDTTGA